MRGQFGAFFMLPGTACFLLQGQRGGVEHKKPWGWNTTTFLTLFCFLWFAPTIRLP